MSQKSPARTLFGFFVAVMAGSFAAASCAGPDGVPQSDGVASLAGALALHEDVVDRGTQCFGMHCCPAGTGVRGFRRDRNELLCRQLVESEEDCFIDGPTVRNNFRACPVGTYLKGIHSDKNLLTCCFSRRRGFSELNNEQIDFGNQEFGMHACPASSTQDGFMTGLNATTNQFLCAKAPTTPSPISTPVSIPSMGPFQAKTFANFFPAVSHTTWKTVVRNWMSRVFNLPVDGSHVQVPTVTIIGADVVDEGVRRRKLSYPSPVDGVPIKAYLLFPPGFTTTGSFPAVLVTHGHSSSKDATGIAWDSSDHAAAKSLAQNGFVVLAPDTRSWSEYLINGQDHGSYMDSLIAETGHDGRIAQMLAVDLFRNVTVLRATQGVDGNRVHAVGLSLGGWQTMYLGALDTRVTGKVVAGGIFWGLSCLNELARLGHHRCQGIPGLSASQDHPGDALLVDAGEIAALIAPRPLYTMWGAADGFLNDPPVPGGTKSCAQDGKDRALATYDRLALTTSFRFGDVTTGQPIPGMAHEIDNTNVLKFLTNTTPADQMDYGTQCNGMHCCPPGKAMGGFHLDRNDLICRDVVATANESCTVTGVQRFNMLACPAGTWAKGFHAGNNQLTCCFDRTRGQIAFSSEAIDPVSPSAPTQVQGMHGCPTSRPMLTGIHLARNQLLCAAR